MEVLHEAPKVSSFVPLAEHQSTTPASFYSGPPILHYYSDRSKLIILDREAQNTPALAPLLQHAASSQQNNEGQINGHSAESNERKTIEEVDVFVTSDKLFLYSNAAAVGVAIPYPSISLHAIQTLPSPASEVSGQGVYMQLISPTAENNSEDAEPESISITVIPTASAPPRTATEDEPSHPVETEDQPEETPVQALFNALSNCSNLHPDPINEDDEDEGGSRLMRAGLAVPGDDSGGLPPPMPGSGGWITAENMHEFVDEDGNWIEDQDDGDEMDDDEAESAAEPLGPGAGTVRSRQGGADGEDDESKWQRTS